MVATLVGKLPGTRSSEARCQLSPRIQAEAQTLLLKTFCHKPAGPLGVESLKQKCGRVCRECASACLQPNEQSH